MRYTRPLAVGPVAAIALAMAIGSAPVAAEGTASIRVDPAQANVGNGDVFTLRVVHDAPVTTSGAEATIVFDPAILAVEAVTPGSAYADAPIVLPEDLTAAAASANATGRLSTIAAAFTPPGSVAPGPQEFLLITFRVVGCGSTDLELPVGPIDGALIDGRQDFYGNPVDVATSPGRVTTCVDAGDVTPGIAGAAVVPPKADSSAPAGLVGAGLVGAATLLAVGLLGGIAWRSRRRGVPA